MAKPVYSHKAYRKAVAAVKRDGPPCGICGLPGATGIDHIRPVSTFPPGTPLEVVNDPANLRPAHLSCNSRRGVALQHSSADGPRRERSPLVE